MSADDPVSPEETGQGEAAPKSTSNNGAGPDESLVARVDNLEAYMEQYVKGYLEDQLETRVSELEAELAELRQELDSLAGLADGQQSTREQRAVDTAMALIRRAKRRPNEDRYAMWYKEVQDALADLGHGSPKVHKPWCFQAMEDVAEAEGFGLTRIKNPDGREVEAVRVRLPELPAEDRPQVSNDITTGIREGPGQLDAKTEGSPTQG